MGMKPWTAQELDRWTFDTLLPAKVDGSQLRALAAVGAFTAKGYRPDPDQVAAATSGYLNPELAAAALTELAGAGLIVRAYEEFFQAIRPVGP